MTDESQICIPADHLSAKGHFPGSPIVPGVVLLDEIIRYWNQSPSDSQQVRAIKFAKFRRTLDFGCPAVLKISSVSEGFVSFQCVTQNLEVIVEGKLAVGE